MGLRQYTGSFELAAHAFTQTWNLIVTTVDISQVEIEIGTPVQALSKDSPASAFRLRITLSDEQKSKLMLETSLGLKTQIYIWQVV